LPSPLPPLALDVPPRRALDPFLRGAEARDPLLPRSLAEDLRLPLAVASRLVGELLRKALLLTREPALLRGEALGFRAVRRARVGPLQPWPAPGEVVLFGELLGERLGTRLLEAELQELLGMTLSEEVDRALLAHEGLDVLFERRVVDLDAR
jgi:hypothetical protein